MNILIFGVSNVGKTIIGRMLASRIGYEFFDIDDEIKKRYGILLEDFVNTGTLMERDRKRGEIIGMLLDSSRNRVIAVTPMSYPEYFEKYLRRKYVLVVELVDTPENIFERLVFSDENDVIYRDDDYKIAHMSRYLKEIREDQKRYGWCFRSVKDKFDMCNDSPEAIVDRIIAQYGLAR